MFDIYNHLVSSESSRDVSWENQFLDNLKEIKVNILQPEPVVGPDNWPYMFLQSDKQGQDYLLNVFDWCLSKGVGVALNPQKELPDYIFTYGMVWSFLKFGTLFPPLKLDTPGQKVFEKDTKLIAGPPTDEYLPAEVRAVLNQFWQQQKLGDIKVLVVSEDSEHFDLCFSLECLGHPPKEEHKEICEAISWFLPHNYSIMLIKEEGMPPFYEL